MTRANLQERQGHGQVLHKDFVREALPLGLELEKPTMLANCLGCWDQTSTTWVPKAGRQASRHEQHQHHSHASGMPPRMSVSHQSLIAWLPRDSGQLA